MTTTAPSYASVRGCHELIKAIIASGCCCLMQKACACVGAYVRMRVRVRVRQLEGTESIISKIHDWTERMTEEQTDRQTDRQTEGQKDEQTDEATELMPICN